MALLGITTIVAVTMLLITSLLRSTASDVSQLGLAIARSLEVRSVSEADSVAAPIMHGDSVVGSVFGRRSVSLGTPGSQLLVLSAVLSPRGRVHVQSRGMVGMITVASNGTLTAVRLVEGSVAVVDARWVGLMLVEQPPLSVPLMSAAALPAGPRLHAQ